jgi:hypothetical protein
LIAYAPPGSLVVSELVLVPVLVPVALMLAEGDCWA